MRDLLSSPLLFATIVSVTACSKSPDDTVDTGSSTTDTAYSTTDTLLDDLDLDGFDASVDCDDTNELIHPGADELCDEVDNDCDEEVDEDDALDAIEWYPDADDDGFGDSTIESITSCDAPEGYAKEGGDCDDTLASVNPGASEVCDELDNDCDEQVDEEAIDAPTWYLDSDGDGYGDPDSPISSCEMPSNAVDNDEDCDDSNPRIYPGQFDCAVEDTGWPFDTALYNIYWDGTATVTSDGAGGYDTWTGTESFGVYNISRDLTSCDLNYSMDSTTPLTSCSQCDFAFDIEMSDGLIDNGPGCAFFSIGNAPGHFDNIGWGFASTYASGTYTFQDVLMYYYPGTRNWYGITYATTTTQGSDVVMEYRVEGTPFYYYSY